MIMIIDEKLGNINHIHEYINNINILYSNQNA